MKKYTIPNKANTKQHGFIVLLAVVVMGILITMSASVWSYTTIQIKASRQSIERGQLLQIAEAGIDKAIFELNADFDFSGETASFGAGEFITEVTSLDADNKEVKSTAYIPDSTNPRLQVFIKERVTIDLENVEFNYGVQIGDGGLSMGPGSSVIGNVYSNGDVTGSGTITGDATVAGGGSPTLDKFCEDAVNDFDMDQNDRRDVAQRFRPSTTGVLGKVEVYIKKTGSPSNITVRILEDDGVDPNKNQVGGSGTIASSLVTENYGWIEATFSSSVLLNANTDYWLTLDTSSTSTKYYSWAYADDNGCTNGVGMYTDSWSAGANPSWTSLVRDFNFRTYMAGVDTMLDGVTVNGDARANILTSCIVGGDAYYDTTNTCTVTGTSNSGSPDEPQASMPVSQAQIDNWKDIAVNGGTHSGDMNVTGTTTIGPLKIDGDLILANNAIVYLSGPVWVDGDISTNNNSQIIVAGVLGNAGTVIIADDDTNPSTEGSIYIFNNATISGNGNPDSYALAISMMQGNAAINLNNNTGGAVYYAANGEVLVANNAGAQQLTGRSVTLGNNASITYDTGLITASFSSGPGGSWSKVPGSYVVVWQ